MKRPLILIAGPTASGKTSSSVLLAKKIGGEIISVDSMQIYKGMTIGTAKATTTEMIGVPHYMIDEWEPDYRCSVAIFKEKVNYYLEKVYEKGKIPILVGGTGFYINAILFDTNFEETNSDQQFRNNLQNIYNTKGADALHQMLREVDEVSANTIHVNNVKRIIRALEYYHITGQCISVHNQLEKEKRQVDYSPYNYTFFALSMNRDVLYSRINIRIDEMIQNGLLEEVKVLFNKEYDEDLPSMKAIGYKEFFPYFRGEKDLEECIQDLKKNTRNYAKRQMTWFRHQSKPIFIEVDKLDFTSNKIVDQMCQYFKY